MSDLNNNNNNVFSHTYRNFNSTISSSYRLFVCATVESNYCPSSPNCELFINRIPKNATENELIPFLEKAGMIYKLSILQNNGYNRGYGYVTYFSEKNAYKAKHILSKMPFMDGKYLIIEDSTNNCRIFVGGVPSALNRDEIWQELSHWGFKQIIDVICYRSYTPRTLNRGFVFLEFRTHAQAVSARSKLQKMEVWGKPLIVDWSIPLPEIEKSVMNNVKILFVRNLDVNMKRSKLLDIIMLFTERERVEKLYKFKNYAFIHMVTREDAEYLMHQLKYNFKGTLIEVEWAKPVCNDITQPFDKDIESYTPKNHNQLYNGQFCYDLATNETFSFGSLNKLEKKCNDQETENCRCTCCEKCKVHKPIITSMNQEVPWCEDNTNENLKCGSIRNNDCLPSPSTSGFTTKKHSQADASGLLEWKPPLNWCSTPDYFPTSDQKLLHNWNNINSTSNSSNSTSPCTSLNESPPLSTTHHDNLKYIYNSRLTPQYNDVVYCSPKKQFIPNSEVNPKLHNIVIYNNNVVLNNKDVMSPVNNQQGFVNNLNNHQTNNINEFNPVVQLPHYSGAAASIQENDNIVYPMNNRQAFINHNNYQTNYLKEFNPVVQRTQYCRVDANLQENDTIVRPVINQQAFFYNLNNHQTTNFNEFNPVVQQLPQLNGADTGVQENDTLIVNSILDEVFKHESC